jgi:hypothetical protein
MVHLSVCLSWHNDGWDDCICRFLRPNAFCIIQEQVRDGYRDELKRVCTGLPLADLPGWFSPLAVTSPLFIRTPSTNFLESITEEILPHSCLPVPCRWMLEVNLHNISKAETPCIHGFDNPEGACNRYGAICVCHREG